MLAKNGAKTKSIGTHVFFQEQKVHRIENSNIFDFKLEKANLKTIARLDISAIQFSEWE